MLSWKLLQRRPDRVIRSLTSLNSTEIISLMPAFEAAYEKERSTWSPMERRCRKIGGGARPLLSRRDDALLFILVYFAIYPTQDFQGLLFGGTQGWVCKWVARLTPVLEAALGERKVLPKRVKQIRNMDEFLESYPELTFIIDGTERPTVRPQNQEKQRKNYSGKKKRHTVKNTILSDRTTNKVVAIGSTFPGSTHDKKMIDTEPISYPPGTVLYQDTGYQGYAPDGVTVLQPRKKHRGEARSDADKAYNRDISRVRVRVEHTIGSMKRLKLVSHVYRNRREGFDDLSMIVAGGLHNFRLEMRA